MADYDYSIEIYIGEVRSGKTLTMVAETYETNYSKRQIYANFHLNEQDFPGYRLITREDIINFWKKKEEFQNAIFLIDELHIFADARKFGRSDNMAVGYWAGQMGKRGNTLRGTTHFMNLIDLRMRLYCERKVFITKGLLVGNRWMPILNNNRVLTEAENEKLCIKAESIVRKMINYDFYHVKDNVNYILAKKYFSMYDTHELVSSTPDPGSGPSNSNQPEMKDDTKDNKNLQDPKYDNKYDYDKDDQAIA